MKDRILGRSGMSVSPLGLGTWSIGGEMYLDGKNDSYGDVNDEESVAAIRTAIDNGVTFFDSADCYGAGHSEKLLGRAIRGKRDDLVIATKFGFVFDQKTKHITGTDYSREYVKRACKGSLKRLGTDYIDLYYIHIWHLEREQALEACEGLEELVEEGYIRYYGWSTDHEECITYLQDRPNFVSIMHNLNVFDNNTMLTDFCERHNLASVNRAPLAMGLLSGKYGKDSVMPKNDVRGNGFEWNRYFTGDRPTPEFVDRLDAVREILRSGGRSLVQGAIAWIWAQSGNTVPVPGFKTVAQAEENARAMEYGPLTPEQSDEINRIIGDLNSGSPVQA